MTEITGWNQGELLQEHEKTPFGELPKNREEYLFTRYKYHHPQSLLPAKYAKDYLRFIEPYIPEALISRLNFTEIKNLASFFTGRITSFFGFETRLNKNDGRADYLLAISSRKGEREALLSLLKKNDLSTQFLQKIEWQRIKTFIEQWSEDTSILSRKVIGLWLEFDTAYNQSAAPVPGLFVQIKPISKDENGNIEDFSWITKELLPILTGGNLTSKTEDMIKKSFTQLPNKSSILFVAAMISRKSSIIRTTIKMGVTQIVPYLESLGWQDEQNTLSSLLDEIKKYSTRIILHLNIGEELNPKIGLECSFSPDMYHCEKRWSAFFDYLIQKGVCLPEKKEQILSFMGVDQEDSHQEFTFESYVPSVKLNNANFTGAIVRYLSHIKIQYQPNQPITAKAYPGVRLFGRPNEVRDCSIQ